MGLIKTRKRGAFLIRLLNLVIISVFLGTSCEKIYEEPSDNVNEAVDFSLAIHAPISVIEVIEHVNSNLLYKGLFQIQADSISAQLGAKVNLLDSVFSDDDSIIYEIAFGGNSPNMFDRKVREGAIQVVVFFNYTEIGSLHKVRISKTNPYKLELPDGRNYVLEGDFTIERLINDRYDINLDKLKIEETTNTGRKIFNCLGNLTYRNILDHQTPGLIGDVLEFDGKGIWQEGNEKYNWNITLPLQVRYDYGCSDYANKGIIVLLNDYNRYNIDFDPFETGACNRIVKITKGGSEFEINLP